MTRRYYVPATHDPILTELNQKWRRTDDEIADEMGFDRGVIYSNRKRLGLPTNHRPRPVYAPKEKEPAPPKAKVNPLQLAKAWLGNRLEERRTGSERNLAFFLDGRQNNFDAVMQETYRLMIAAGVETQILNPRWRP